MKRLMTIVTTFALGISLVLTSCGPAAPNADGKKTVVVTYSVLGSVVKELVGTEFNVCLAMPNGLDPHEW